MIIKTRKGYKVVSEKTHRSFGTYKTKQEAKERLKQVEFFKYLNEENKRKTKKWKKKENKKYPYKNKRK